MDFALPPVGEGLVEVELVRWLVKPGDDVRRGQSLIEVMSDKATMEVPSPFAGTIAETIADEGAKVNVGEVVLRYEPTSRGVHPPGAGEPGEPAGASPAARHTNRHANGLAVAAAPSVRLLARKLGVDLSRVPGSGPAGRVLVDDLAPFLAPPADAPSTKPTREPVPMEFGTPGTRQKMVGLRRAIAERMVESERAIPHYSYVDECDVSDLVRRPRPVERIVRAPPG